MKNILFIASLFLSLVSHAQSAPLWFYPLKEWTIREGGTEVSYPLTKGTNYCLDLKNMHSGRFTLLNSKREILFTQEIHGSYITWRSTKTEICYIRFENTNRGLVTIGFNRLELQIAKFLKP